MDEVVDAHTPCPSTTHFQARERSYAGSELVGFDVHSLEHAHEQIAQRRILVFVERQLSVGTSAPLRVHDKPYEKPSLDSGRLANRVSPCRCSAAN